MMTRINTALLLIILLLTPTLVYCGGQSSETSGWTFSQRFSGSSNAAGVVLKTNSTATYHFNPHVQAYAGFPVYFARQSSASGSESFINGIGNAYAGLFVIADHSLLRYSSDLVVTAPTGDSSRGFSTGVPTIDWTNTFSHSFGVLTPYVSVGAANTISDTSFFVRPFSSKGIVGHFELGAQVDMTSRFGVGASGYGVRAKGEQQIVSKVVEEPAPEQTGSDQAPLLSQIGRTTGLGSERRPSVFQRQRETIGPAEIANDNGLSTWFSVRPTRATDLHIGYSRSMTYQLNSFFFGVGFRVGH